MKLELNRRYLVNIYPSKLVFEVKVLELSKKYVKLHDIISNHTEWNKIEEVTIIEELPDIVEKVLVKPSKKKPFADTYQEDDDLPF